MFNRLTLRFAALPPKSLLNILRNLMEGDTSLEHVIQADDLDTIESLLERTRHTRGVSPMVDTLPTRRRLNINHNGLITTKQLTIGFAIRELVNVFTYRLYALNEASVEAQCFVLNSLKNDLMKTIKSKEKPVLIVVTEFQKMINVLLNSWIDTDDRHFAEKAAIFFIDLEVTRRAPVNKSITSLLAVKERIKRDLIFTQGSMFAKTSCASAHEICRLVDKIPAEIDVSQPDCGDLIEVVNGIYTKVSGLVSTEYNSPSRTGIMRKLWAELNQMITSDPPLPLARDQGLRK